MSELSGQELRDLRLTLGFTQEELAEIVGTSTNTVARWERSELGMRHPAILKYMLQSLIEIKQQLNLNDDQIYDYAMKRMDSLSERE